MPTPSSRVTIGILAHVDAGKTSLTERLLHHAGVLDRLGSVDGGDTQTDTLDQERRRGITIRSAVVALPVSGVRVHVVDTPGHPDFVAEVERALAVLDGVVLVVSAVEGVQPQTRVIARTLQRLGMPTVVFVNKIDRRGARTTSLVDELRGLFDADLVVLTDVEGAGTRDATTTPVPLTAPSVVETLAAHDDGVLARWIDGTPQPPDALAAVLARADVVPLLFGSAVTGEGVDALVDAVLGYLPRSGGDPDGPLDATVFAMSRGRGGAKLAQVRVRSGTLRPRTVLGGDRVTEVAVYARGAEPVAGPAVAGDIALVRGLASARIGDRLGELTGADARPALFAPPSLETEVTPARPADGPRLHAALLELADQDPLIGVRRDPGTGALTVALYGEVQQEVLHDTLLETYGVEARFAPPRVLLAERVVGTGEALSEMGNEIGTDVDGGPSFFVATIGLRVEPGEPGGGVQFRLAVELGSLPLAFHTAIEETVHATLQQGLAGWPVLDPLVTLTRTGYSSPVSAAGDFRSLTPLVLMAALAEAGTQVLEPVHEVELEVPTEAVPAVLAMLGAARGTPEEVLPVDAGQTLVRASVPAAELRGLGQALPGATHGLGTLTSRWSGHRPVAGTPPTRPRTDGNPLDRKEYLLHAFRTR
ncbi:GTP-binding protein [Pseudonocardia sp. CA-107938]|uniref:GTP-binding protein n=1 Tax=Pseudonocardia sp. CA-107938 TaxID=3240021 RepID=UPI003D8F95C7